MSAVLNIGTGLIDSLRERTQRRSKSDPRPVAAMVDVGLAAVDATARVFVSAP